MWGKMAAGLGVLAGLSGLMVLGRDIAWKDDVRAELTAGLQVVEEKTVQTFRGYQRAKDLEFWAHLLETYYWRLKLAEMALEKDPQNADLLEQKQDIKAKIRAIESRIEREEHR